MFNPPPLQACLKMYSSVFITVGHWSLYLFFTNFIFHLRTGHECPEGEYRYTSTLSLTLALGGVGWSTPRPGRFTHGNDPIPILQEDGWAPGTVWTVTENSPTTGIRSSERPVRSESLYRLSYPGTGLHFYPAESGPHPLVLRNVTSQKRL